MTNALLGNANLRKKTRRPPTLGRPHVAEAVALFCGDAAKLMNGSIVRADGAGVFSFCGRYLNLGVETALNALPPDGTAAFEGAAPSVTVHRAQR